MARGEDIDSLTVKELIVKCKELGIGTTGKKLRKDDYIQRLNEYNALNAQTPRLSDIDEEGESASERSTTPRRRTRGRSVDSDSRRLSLSELSTRSRTRSSSRTRGNESGRRRSYSIPKTPTPINDVLMRNEDPFERSPQRAVQLEQRLANIEGKQQSTDDRLGDMAQNQTGLYQELGCLKEFREHARSKIDKLENGEELIKQFKENVNSYFSRHVRGVNESIAKVESAYEGEIESIKSENVKTYRKITAEIKSVKGELSSRIETGAAKFDAYKDKVEKMDNDFADVWTIINDHVIEELKILKSEQSKLKSELSKLKSQIRCLLLLSSMIFGFGLLLTIIVTDFVPFNAAIASDAILNRFRLCWIWFQRSCFQPHH